MNPVVHFEMPAKDMNRMTDFYSKVFGWQTHNLGEEMGHYVTVSTTKTNEHGRPEMAGAINGGFFPINDDRESYYPSIVIAVDNIYESIKNINEMGGKVLGEPVQIPGVGIFASFIDTEGNRASILQPIM